MKKFVLIVLGFCLLINNAGLAQNAKKKAPQPKVPPVVLEAFTAKYPDLKPTDWDWEAQKEIYEADFTDKGKVKEATFSPAGKWLKTKTDMNPAELPATVSKAASSGELTSWSITEVAHIESPDKGVYYKIRFKKGTEEQSLKFDANGQQLENKDSVKKTQKS